MKKFYLFMVLMLTAVTSAFAQEPTFTAEGAADDAATWYYIQFQRGAKAVLSTYNDSEGSNVMTAYASKEDNLKPQQLFKLVGAADGFAIISKGGYHLTFNGSLKMSKQGTAEKNFTLLRKGVGAFDGPDVFQIQVKGQDQGSSFNPSGGPYIGKHIALYTTGDPSNPLKFVAEADMQAPEKVNPQFVTAFDKNSAQWYQIMFITNTNDGGPVFEAKGEGEAVGQENPITDKENEAINKQLWQFVGSESEFELVNKEGMYAYYEGGRLRTSPTSKGHKFTFKAQNGAQFSGLATQIMLPNGQGLNANGGVKAGAQVGAWDDQDINNSLMFVPVDMPVAQDEFTVAVTATGRGSAANVNLEGVTNGKVTKGAKVKLIAQQGANDIFLIKDIKVNGTHFEGDYLLKKSFETELTINEDTNIEVEFFIPPMIGVRGAAEGTELEHATVELSNTIKSDGSDYIAYPNKDVVITATPDEGYEIKSITLKWYGENYEEFTKDLTTSKTFTVKAGVSDPNVPLPEVYGLLVEVVEKAAAQVAQDLTEYDADGNNLDALKYEGAFYGNDSAFVLEGKGKHSGQTLVGDEIKVAFYDDVDTREDDCYFRYKEWELSKLTVTQNGETEDILATRTFIVKGDYKINFELKKKVVTKEITIPTIENGTLTLDGVKSGDKVAVGTEVAITATAKEGFELESITVGGKDVTKAKKFTVGEDNTIVVKFKKITAVESLEGISYQVYPNPATDVVELHGFAPNTELRLIALTGKTVISTKTDFEGNATLNVSDLAHGLYLIRSGKIVVKLQVR